MEVNQFAPSPGRTAKLISHECAGGKGSGRSSSRRLNKRF